VIALIATGRETPQIAQALGVSPATVRTHVRNALSKLGAHTRAQLVAIVIASQDGHRLADAA
jgi:DNA-binding NarL/FixJ family response regulator